MPDLIDWTKVNELRDEIGAEDFDEVVELFLEEVEETISVIGQAGRTLEHDLHFLKGSALNLGFAQFSDLCRDGEAAAAKGEEARIDVDAVVTLYQASRAQFLAELETRLAG